MGKKLRKVTVSIKSLTTFMIVAVVLSIIATGYGLYRTIKYANNLYELEQERKQCDDAIQRFMDGSDYLTLFVQQYVIKGDRAYMDNYWNEVNKAKSRDEAVETLQKLNLTEAEHNAVVTAKNESDSLIRLETWAMRMVAESNGISPGDMPGEVSSYVLNDSDKVMSAAQKRNSAVSKIFGPEYSISKTTIRSNVDAFRREIADRYADEAFKALEVTERATYLMAGGLTLFFIFLFGSIYFFTSLVAAPLIVYSDRFASGNLVKLPERGATEIRRLARSYNALSEQVEQNTERLARLGYIDYLTDVPNRASITEYVTNLIENNKSPVGLMIADIDNFKRFNDTYGHAVGDDVLRAVAKAACSVVPEDEGISGRLCGEEFIIVCRSASKQSLGKIASEILENVRNISLDKIAGGDATITVSIGGMIWRGEPGADFTCLLAKADKALYISKTSGKDRYTFCEE